MALVSPGVEVTIIDQSQYLPAPTNSVPFVLLATAQNKANPNGTGVAAATTAANANKLTIVTSQRDLVSLYGTPFFYSTTNGTPIQGYELNEYGLLAAYSLLGITNRCYVLRADVDLTSLVGQTSRPTGLPANGTYWLDTTNSTWGIFLFNSTTGRFTQQIPIVITNPDDLSAGVPLTSIGNIGSYAVNAIQVTGYPTNAAEQQFFYKTTNNQWVVLGGADWNLDIPCVQATTSNPSLTAAQTFTISMSGLFTATITVPAGPNNTVAGVAGVINALNYDGLTAAVVSDKLVIYSNQLVTSGNAYLTMGAGLTGTALSDLGITAGTYNQPIVQWGTSAQMPLWTTSQTTPRPTGSVWMKAGSAGNGVNAVVSVFSTATNTFIAKTVSSHTSDSAACANLDATGGQTIPAGSIYGQYSYGGNLPSSPYYLWERLATGATVITSSLTSYSFTSGDIEVQVSVPGSSTLSSAYTVSVPTSTDATDFTAAWQSTGIPYTTATLNTDGAIVLTHTAGGVIVLNDFVAGVSNGLVVGAGFEEGTTIGCKYGPTVTTEFSAVAQLSTTGSGSTATFNVQLEYGVYTLVGDGVQSGGTGYALGDSIVISGAVLGGVVGANNLTVKVAAQSGGIISAVAIVSGTGTQTYTTQLSNWVEFTYIANEGAPSEAPAEDTNWFYSVVDQVDIMVQKNGSWIGYRNTSYDATGAPAATGSNTTDPTGPIISATRPTTQSDGTTTLSYGDLWIDTSDLEVYPVIHRWEQVSGEDTWVLIDNTDQISSNGVLFQDARWATSGSVSPVDDPIPTITSLLSSNYLDLDAPSPDLYPQGMLLFNTRRSGYNVKKFKTNYFNAVRFPDESLPAQTSTWLSVSGNQSTGAPYMGRFAQRSMIVESLRASIDTNTDIRDEDNYFNLLATPNYPELQPNMVVLNADRGETGYIIGDTPLGLTDSATEIQAWANNTAGATSTGEKGLVTRSTYLGLFYPSGITTDLTGNEVVVPASHMMLRTFLRNDNIAFPWLAAAGTRRGNIDNALNIGYLNRTTDEFVPIKTRIGIRDVLYTNQINPMVFFTGVGLLNYGNKNSFDSTSSLDRTNVARLVNYIRRQLTIAARPFVFEPNDSVTRQSIAGVVQTLLVDLVAKRGIYDYLVVCDESNNTPARIDRSELWIDVAIEPVKAAEFIYIPVRILNTGEIGNQAQ